MERLLNDIAYMVGIFSIPLFFAALGFIEKKSTKTTYGYQAAWASLIVVLLIVAFNVTRK